VNSKSAADIRSACVVWRTDNGQQVTAIELTRVNGETVPIDSFPPPFPWAHLDLISEGEGGQWLVVDYYNTEPRPDGASRLTLVYSLSPPQKLLTARPQRVEVKDLDQDGTTELVLYEVLSPTRYDIQVGWPHVYTFRGTLESESLRRYPAAVRSFLDEASQTATHLKDVCKVITETSQSLDCDYADDIRLLETQIGLAKTILIKEPQ